MADIPPEDEALPFSFESQDDEANLEFLHFQVAGKGRKMTFKISAEAKTHFQHLYYCVCPKWWAEVFQKYLRRENSNHAEVGELTGLLKYRQEKLNKETEEKNGLKCVRFFYDGSQHTVKLPAEIGANVLLVMRGLCSMRADADPEKSKGTDSNGLDEFEGTELDFLPAVMDYIKKTLNDNDLADAFEHFWYGLLPCVSLAAGIEGDAFLGFPVSELRLEFSTSSDLAADEVLMSVTVEEPKDPGTKITVFVGSHFGLNYRALRAQTGSVSLESVDNCINMLDNMDISSKHAICLRTALTEIKWPPLPDLGDTYIPLSMDDVQTLNEVTIEEEVATTFREARFGSAVMWIPDLDPKWRSGKVSQRPLIPDLVRTLIQSMKRTSPCRVAEKDRLLVSMTYAEFEESVQYTASQMAIWFQEKEFPKAYTVDALKTFYKNAATKSFAHVREAPILLWAPNLKTKPQLDRGQHRRKALIEFMVNKADTDEEKPPEKLTPKSVETLTWVVDIANLDQLNTRYYRLLRANKPDQYKADSEGDLFCQLNNDVWDNWLESERQQLNKEEYPKVDDRFRFFVEKELSLPEFKNAKRYLTLLSNNKWRQCAADWTAYDMGRATFKVHQFTEAASLFLDEFFVPFFTLSLRKLDKILGPWSKRILADDMKLLHKLKEPFRNVDSLRGLAFPLEDDDPKKSKFGTNKVWFIKAAEFTTSQGQFFIKLGQNAPTTKYTFRRPGFCTNLEKESDFTDFIAHLSKCAFQVPTLTEVMESASITGKTLSLIARHAIYWADPLFQQPSNADPARKTLDYVKMMDELYLPKGSQPSSDNEALANDASLAKIAEARQNNITNIRKWHMVIMNLIREDKTDFNNALKAHRLDMPQGIVAQPVKLEDRRAYRENFYYSPWRVILTSTIKILGSANFKGVMTYFHKYPNAHLQGSSQARLEDTLQKFFSVHGPSRMHNLEADKSRYYHTDRVNDAARLAIFKEELRTALLILQDVKRCQVRLDLKTLDSETHSLEDLSSDEEDQNSSSSLKHLGTDINSIQDNACQVVRDRILLLKDFGLNIPAYEDDPDVTMGFLGPAPKVSAESKLEGETSDYEAPKLITKTPKGTKKRAVQDDEGQSTPKKKSRARRA